MTTPTINKVEDVFRFADHLKSECERSGETGLAEQIDDAMHLGSSTLEILGALRQIILGNAASIHQLLGEAGNAEADQVVEFVNKAYGR